MKAEIFNKQFWLPLWKLEDIAPQFNRILLDCRFTILDFVEHTFDNNGYTALWLLGESHLAIHTFPEENKMYVELSGCNKDMTTQFENTINKF